MLCIEWRAGTAVVAVTVLNLLAAGLVQSSIAVVQHRSSSSSDKAARGQGHHQLYNAGKVVAAAAA
eukprot:491-Heterococcus_DN1.PRE.1